MLYTKLICDKCGKEFVHQDDIVTVTVSEYNDPDAKISTCVYKTYPKPKHYHRMCYLKREEE